MKPGDLAYVSGTSTGDKPWVVELYRTRKPVLVFELEKDGDPWALVLYDGMTKYLRKWQLKVIET